MKPATADPSRRCQGDAGFVGGAESMLFGALIFVFGILLLFNAWAVVDAKMGATSAARESVREYVESDGDLALALDSGRRAFESSTGLDPTAIDFTVEGIFERCSRVTVTASYQVPAIRLPFGGWGNGFNVAASHSEIVDPFRSGLKGAARCR